MNREELIRIAREACDPDKVDAWQNGFWVLTQEELERFATLVAAAEREECAKVCEAGVDYEHPTVKGHIMENFGHSRLLAKAIRARGQA
jgi:hypothetical protein